MWPIPHSLQDLDENYIKQIGPYINSFFYKETLFHRFNQDLRRIFRCYRKDYILEEKSDRYSSQEMIRDLFLWCVYMGYEDIAFVLLLQIKLRTGAALLAAGMAKRVSLLTSRLDVRHMFTEQATKYAAYAKECVEACYRRNEECSWRMLLLPRSFYGDATYMQVSRKEKSSELFSISIFSNRIIDGHRTRHCRVYQYDLC